MKPKRILMIAQSTYNYDPRIMRYCKALRELEYEIDVICLNYNNDSKYEEVDGVRVYRIMRRFSIDSIVTYFFYSLFFLINSLIKTISLSRKNSYSLVHVHNMPDYLVFAALYPKLKKVPVVIDIHDLTVELFKEKWGPGKFKFFKPVLAGIEKISIKFADEVITVSDQCAEKLLERGLKKDKLTIVMNVPDLRYFTYHENGANKTDSKFHLIYHGTIVGRYGLHSVIKVLPLVLQKNPNIVFHLIGRLDSEYGIYLQELVKELKVEKNVIFEELVPYYEVGNRLKSADVGIVLSENTEYSNFGIPTKIFEYAAVGLPVIVTNLASVNSAFRDCSMIFVDPDNTSQIANEIIRISTNSESRKILARNARADLEKISYQVMVKRYINLIDKIVIE